MKEIPLNIIRRWPEGFEARLQHVWLDVVSFIPNVKLFDLQRVLAEFGFTMQVYEDAAPRWQPIETAPKDARVLLWGKYWNGQDSFQHPLIGLWDPQAEQWFVPGEFRFKVHPTHWAPVLSPPEAGAR